MLENFLMIGNQVLILFVLIGVGFLCSRVKILNDNAVKGITDFILYIVTPCVIVNSYIREFQPEMLKGLLITIAASFASFAINILFSYLLIHDKDKQRETVLRFGAVFSNCGYMSLPLQQAVLGEEGVFYGATYIAIFNVVLWTYGVCLMDGGLKNISIGKIIKNPSIISVFSGIIIFVLSVKLPSVITEPIGYFAAVNTPLPMVLIGYHLANASLKLTDKASVISIIFRLIISPALMIGCMYLIGMRGTIPTACAIAVASPSAAVTTMFAQKFNKDVPLSAALVSVSTLFSVITMPVMVAISMSL